MARKEGKKGGREGGRKEGRKGGKEGGRKEGRKGGREGGSQLPARTHHFRISLLPLASGSSWCIWLYHQAPSVSEKGHHPVC